MHKIIYILFTAISLTSCCKDPIINIIEDNNTNCSEKIKERTIPITDYIIKQNTIISCMLGVEYIPLSKHPFDQICINPNNRYEFCYYINTSPEFREIRKYNFCTNEDKLITTKGYYNIDWSRKDWIIFTGTDLQLWKIKSDGTSLTQLTNSGNYNNDAIWNYSGSKFLFYNVQVGKMQLADENGNLIQTIPSTIRVGGNSQWVNDSIIITVLQGQTKINAISELNINTLLSKNIYETDESIGRISIYKDEIYFSTNNIYQYKNNQLTFIDSTYKTYKATYFQKINEDYSIFRRNIIDTSGYDSCIVYNKTYLSVFNNKTKEERALVFPE